ncbi:hypothetical protein PENTCL1PPCAC_3787, partial [Pristionchus entomophagus]
MLRLALISALCYGATALCPAGFDLVRNGECYRQVTDAFNMYSPNGPVTAVEECEPYNAEPVIIKTKEDNDYWMSVAEANHQMGSNKGFILLGLKCSKSNDHWKWSDGTNIDFRPDDYDPDLLNACDTQNPNRCMWTINPVTNNWQSWCNLYHTVDMYCIIPPSVNPVETDRDCASFSHDDDDDVCYQVGMTPTNWTEANTVCHSFGANVASVHNDQENNFVRRLAVSKGLINGMMLGATTNGKKSFKWADGTKFDYDNFAKGFPLDGFGECLAMDTNNAGGQWMNVECSTELPFACVRQTDAKVPVCDGGLKQEEDIIYSPGFPTSSSEPCDFLLKVEPGLLVEVEILFLEANQCCDHLVLFEGTLGGNQIAILSGDRQNGLTFRTSSQNVMRASWQPNGGVNVKGMMV